MQLSVLRREWTTCTFAFLLTMTMVRPAAADTLTLMWDRSPDASVAGYLVYVGTQSGVYGATYDVGNSTQFAYANALAGQPYYFAVAAYYPGPVVGARSAEVTGSTNGAPVLLNPGHQTSLVGSPVSLQLVGSDPAGQPVTYGSTTLPPGLSLAPSTGLISGTPTTPGSFLVSAVVSDGVLSDVETFTWTITQHSTDTIAPLLSITTPTAHEDYAADTSFLLVGGTAFDNTGVTEVTWSTDRGASGVATGTENWIAGILIQRGPNIITVRARDAAGNTSSRILAVKFTGKGR